MNRIKDLVKEKYGKIARESNTTEGCGCCGDGSYTNFSEKYENLEGYNPDADLGLGCGLPTEYAGIKKGNIVIDLGSGAGNDCFVASSLVGEEGKVIGIDFTREMINKSRENAEKLGYTNVQFRFGDIENMPVTSKKADVIISNCVLNLVPDKRMAFMEICRVLKVGGHFCISDVVTRGALPSVIRDAVEMYAGCVAGAMDRDEYIALIEEMGFINITIHKEKEINLPDNVLKEVISDKEIEDFRRSGTGIFSLTVSGEKPSKNCVCCGN